jgi:hypothetical protein
MREVPRAYREGLTALEFLVPWGTINPNTHGHVRVGVCRLQPLTSSLYAGKHMLLLLGVSQKQKNKNLPSAAF